MQPLHLVSPQSPSPRLASASKDGTVRIWNTATRKLDFVLTGHAASVNVVRWGGENVIYTGSSDRTVKIWSGVDVRGFLILTLRCHSGLIGQAHTHAIGACPLGQYDGSQHRLCDSDRAIRSYQQNTKER